MSLEVRPQPGPQEAFLSSPADIVFYGGAAGGGKTYGLLIEPLRHKNNKDFGAVIFRRTYSQITNEGGLWDVAGDLYPSIGGRSNSSDMYWQFPSGMAVNFGHMQHEKDRFSYQGSQIPLICWDELTQFTRKQFFYLLSRNRSVSGVPGYQRATMNPVPPDDKVGGWVYRDFVAWYIGADGFPIPERSGVIRYFVVVNDTVQWADTAAELKERFPEVCSDKIPPTSFTFIPASVHDNQALLEKDPGYLSKLNALPYVERMQLLGGNWHVRPTAGSVFQRAWFPIVDAMPPAVRTVRMWDRAATEKTANNDPDATAGIKVSHCKDGYWYVEHAHTMHGRAAAVEDAITNLAEQDGQKCEIGLFQDPGAAGKGEADYMVKKLAGYTVHVEKISIDKLTAAKPVSAQAERGNIRLLRGPWNDAFLRVLESFPDGGHDDEVDGLSGAFNILSGLHGKQLKVGVW